MKLDWIGENIATAFWGICLSLDGIIYSLISSAYKIFMSLASARILSSDAYMEIANKIYIIIGVLMLFVLAYAILKGIIDPDQMTKGDMGGPKILKSVVIAVIGLALTPTIFNIMYQAQGLFLEKDVIANIFFRSGDDTISVGTIDIPIEYENSSGDNATGNMSLTVNDVPYNKEIKNLGGNVTASTLFYPFFRPYGVTCEDVAAIENCDPNKSIEEQIISDPSKVYATNAANWGGLALACAGAVVGAIAGTAAGIFSFGTTAIIGISAAGATCAGAAGAAAIENGANAVLSAGDSMSLAQAYSYAAQTGDFNVFQSFIPNLIAGQITYTWFISALVGGFVCYSFITFSIDMGVRAGKLAYYQIIAPLPIIMQILPKFKEPFKRYINSVISTFLEVFIRISVIYVIVYIICHINDIFSGIGGAKDSIVTLNWFEGTIASALLIVGLVIFAKSAPKLISDTFGIQSGNLSFGIGKKLADGEVFTAGAVLGGAVTSGVRNFRNTWAQNKGAGIGRRASRTALSTLGGMGSAVARGIHGRAVSHKPVATARDMRDMAGKTANEVTDARERRNRFRADAYTQAGVNPSATGIGAFIDRQVAVGRAHVRRADEAVSKWATGSVDMTYENTVLSSLGKLEDFKNTIRAKTAKDSNVQYWQAAYDDALAKQVDRFKDQEYKDAVEQAVKKVESRKASYATEDEYNAALTNARNSVNREAFMMSDSEFAKATQDLAVQRNSLKSALEAAQDRAAMDLLAQQDAGMIQEMQQFFTNNLNDFNTIAGHEVKYTDLSGAAKSGTFKSMMEELYGFNFDTGQMDIAAVTRGKNGVAINDKGEGTVVMTIKPTNGQKDYNINAQRDSSGNITYTRADGSSFDIGGNLHSSITQQQLTEFLKQEGCRIEAKTTVTQVSDDAKKGKRDMYTNAEYNRKAALQRQQQNNNK